MQNKKEFKCIDRLLTNGDAHAGYVADQIGALDMTKILYQNLQHWGDYPV